MTSFLIEGALGILTGMDGEAARAHGAVRVENGRIAAVGELAPRPGERRVDASGCVVAPGLVNTHHHLFQSVLKGVPAGLDQPLASWLRLVPYTHWDRIDEEALRVSATIGLAELALSGATTVLDHHYFYSPAYDFDPNEILFEVADRFGLRFVLARGGATTTRRFDGADAAPLPTEPLETMIDAVEAAARRWHDPAPDAMRRVVFAPTTPTFSLRPEELRIVAAEARRMGLRLHSHLSENGDYAAHTLAAHGRRPVHWLAEHDWLGEDVFFAHLWIATPTRWRFWRRPAPAWPIARRRTPGSARASRPLRPCRGRAGASPWPSTEPPPTRRPTWRRRSMPASACTARREAPGR